ncbi:MAG: sulfatase [bacterium]|nr:sulfatase [bacterium]
MKLLITGNLKTAVLSKIFMVVFLSNFFVVTTISLGIEKEEIGSCRYGGYNLIMISINNVGVKHMSLYGYKRNTTPYLDKWSQNAAVFDNAFSPDSWTLPVATSLFTSLYPYTHKVMQRYRTDLLNKSISTLPDILKKSGYKTAAFTGGLDYYKEFGHMLGFEETDNNPNFTGFDVTLTQARDWLSRNSDKKFFLFIHGYDAHPPFTPPEKFKGIFSDPKGKNIIVYSGFSLIGIKNSDNKYVASYISLADPFAGTQPARIQKPAIPKPEKMTVILTQDDIDYLRDLYDEEVLSVDSKVGDFLSSLDENVLKKTIIIIFSEHGEMFALHGRFGRGGIARGTLYDDVVHVPLMIKIPQREGKRINGLAQLIDVMPTVLELLDIPFTGGMQGKTLIPLIKSNISVNDYVYAGSEFNMNSPFHDSTTTAVSAPPRPILQSINESIRDYKWKLIHEIQFSGSDKNKDKQVNEETYELYDIKNDPDELINLTDKHPVIKENLQKEMEKWAKWSKEFSSARPSTQEIPEKIIKDAREHGYW